MAKRKLGPHSLAVFSVCSRSASFNQVPAIWSKMVLFVLPLMTAVPDHRMPARPPTSTRADRQFLTPQAASDHWRSPYRLRAQPINKPPTASSFPCANADFALATQAVWRYSLRSAARVTIDRNKFLSRNLKNRFSFPSAAPADPRTGHTRVQRVFRRRRGGLS
jgi:hypothetical protein